MKEDNRCFLIFRENRILARNSRAGENQELSPAQLQLLFGYSELGRWFPPHGEWWYVGQFHGQDCYALIWPDALDPPAGTLFYPLRTVLFLLEDELFSLASLGYHYAFWAATHRFCGRCGTLTRGKADERALVCPECGLVHYPNPVPAVIVAIVKGKQILLARSSKWPQGFYSVLAGYVEPGENLEAAVRREVAEEVSLEIKNIRYFGSQPWLLSGSQMVGFTADYAAGHIQVDGKEILAANWFSPEEFPQIPSSKSMARGLINWFVEHGSRA